MRHRVLSSSAFRLSVAYLVIFACSSLVLMGFLYAATVGYMRAQTDATIEAEIEGLADVYQRDGLSGLVAVIRERVTRAPGRSSIYLLADRGYTPLVGNLDRWPETPVDNAGWMDFALQGPAGAQSARGRPFHLRGDLNLLVGRDVDELAEMRALIEQALVWGLVVILGLGLTGGAIFSLRSVRRLETIMTTSQQVMEGDLSQRVPLDAHRDDIDRLARNLNAMLDRLERSMAGIQHVSDSIAHDLRTPLTRLRNRLEALAAPAAGAAITARDLAGCTEEVDGLLTTFNVLLRIARLEAGGEHAALPLIELDEVLSGACELYAALAEERGLRLVTAIDRVNVHGDSEVLAQAICNVLDNAVKYSPPGGTVSVSLERVETLARLVIADRGPGISPADRDRVFERFYRGDHSRGTPGNGLGLSLAKAVFDYHRATLTLADNHPGLCFIADIPLADAMVHAAV